MEIRELQEQEIDLLLDLYNYLHSSDDPLPERNVVQSTWKEITESSHFKYFGVFLEERLVSSCTLSLIPNLTRGCRCYGVIENVVTHAEFRQQGFGRKILNFALQFAWSENCYKVMLLTGRKDEATYRFYESVGFDRYAKQAFLAKPVEQAH